MDSDNRDVMNELIEKYCKQVEEMLEGIEIINKTTFQTGGISIIIAFIAGIITIFRTGWLVGLTIIFVGFLIFILFTAIAKNMQLQYMNHIFMTLTHENMKDLSDKVDIKNIVVDVMKKKRK